MEPVDRLCPRAAVLVATVDELAHHDQFWPSPRTFQVHLGWCCACVIQQRLTTSPVHVRGQRTPYATSPSRSPSWNYPPPSKPQSFPPKNASIGRQYIRP